jgi:hypothetical protein
MPDVGHAFRLVVAGHIAGLFQCGNYVFIAIADAGLTIGENREN